MNAKWMWMSMKAIPKRKAHLFLDTKFILLLRSCTKGRWHKSRLTPYTGPDSGKCLHCLKKEGM